MARSSLSQQPINHDEAIPVVPHSTQNRAPSVNSVPQSRHLSRADASLFNSPE